MSHALYRVVEKPRQGASLSTAEMTVVDSSFTDQALRFQELLTAKIAQEGKDMEAILSHVEEVKKTIQSFILVFTLEKIVKEVDECRVNGLLSSLLTKSVLSCK